MSKSKKKNLIHSSGCACQRKTLKNWTRLEIKQKLITKNHRARNSKITRHIESLHWCRIRRLRLLAVRYANKARLKAPGRFSRRMLVGSALKNWAKDSQFQLQAKLQSFLSTLFIKQILGSQETKGKWPHSVKLYFRRSDSIIAYGKEIVKIIFANFFIMGSCSKYPHKKYTIRVRRSCLLWRYVCTYVWKAA